MSISADERRRLDEIGFVILESWMEPELLDELRQRVAELFESEAEAAGSEYFQEPGARRLANLVDKGEVFRRVIAQPKLRPYLESVLGSALKLSSLNVRSVNPHCEEVQPLHCDMAAIPDEKGYWVCNTVWMLDDITMDNGPIRAVPGSHKTGRLPADVLDDAKAPHPDEVYITGQAGTVVVMNAHTWHGGTANHTDHSRTALHAFFCRWDKPQQQFQKQLLSQAVQESLTPELRSILALDDPLNDKLSAQVAVRSGFMK